MEQPSQGDSYLAQLMSNLRSVVRQRLACDYIWLYLVDRSTGNLLAETHRRFPVSPAHLAYRGFRRLPGSNRFARRNRQHRPQIGRVPLLLMDCDIEENDPEEREITDRLYAGAGEHRLRQEIVLGIGGVRALRALGTDPCVWHLNEGHAAFLTLERAREYVAGGDTFEQAIQKTRQQNVFTTHTPVEAGHDKFSYGLVAGMLDGYFDVSILRAFAGQDRLNMTRLALSLSDYVNGVARRHAETSRRLFPGYRVRAITNGVHSLAWTSPGFVALYNKYMPGWCHEPELLARADRVVEALRRTKLRGKRVQVRRDRG